MNKNLELVKAFIDNPSEETFTNFLNNMCCKACPRCNDDCPFLAGKERGARCRIIKSFTAAGAINISIPCRTSKIEITGDPRSTINLARLWTEFTEMYYGIMVRK